MNQPDASFKDILMGEGFDPKGIKRFSHQPLQGFHPRVLYRMLRANDFEVDKCCRDKLIYHMTLAPIHAVFAHRENRLFGKQIDETELAAPPIFILGHWRNGTTFLEKLICLDPNHTYPRAFQSFFPGSFLLPRVELLIRIIEARVQLKTRPMDNMKFTLYEPWEDEFMMAALTGISPYIRVLFPRTMGRESGYRYPDFRNAREVQVWRQTFVRLLKRLTLYENKRIVLKSPPHTARIKLLLELFPEAKFVHIVRHPYDVFPSNVKVWRDALRWSFLQEVDRDEIIEIIFSTYEQMYEKYFCQKAEIPENNLIEVRFEDLERDPVAKVREIYERLDLPGFEQTLPRIRSYLDSLRHYKKNVFQVSPELKQVIQKRWWKTFDVYGYRN